MAPSVPADPWSGLAPSSVDAMARRSKDVLRAAVVATLVAVGCSVADRDDETAHLPLGEHQLTVEPDRHVCRGDVICPTARTDDPAVSWSIRADRIDGVVFRPGTRYTLLVEIGGPASEREGFVYAPEATIELLDVIEVVPADDG